ncbi:hypothetical protein POTOM_034362 [Populus tomentosa]|uniref:Homeobox domain-containing protein n=1 Tax=Populus tomentosa TaxID=118781 RepID=A0A8X8CG20_POPTO|nr:hypothetical protein POTOM_034362 [Populus tomentosa]
MKSELADQIGLTEKQISSWFCHRRLKDKRLRDEVCTNGRQDRSSGIIQDRGSGLRQDSCGSTKQGDYRNLDPREVESQRLYGRDFHPADLTYDRTSRYTGNVTGIDNISSGSSSSLQDKFVCQREDPYDAETSKYVAQNGAAMPLIPKDTDSFGYKPSGYLKVKGEIENAAITAVKMQLGRHYKEDGPPLGVEFQPLPPGAFASPSRDPVNGPIYVGDLAQICSPDVSGVRKQSSLGTFEAQVLLVHAGNLYILRLSITSNDVCHPMFITTVTFTLLLLPMYHQSCTSTTSNYAHNMFPSSFQYVPKKGSRYEVYSTKMSSHDSYTEGANCNPEPSDSHDRKSHHHLEQKPTYNGSNSNAGGNSAMDIPDDLAGETSAYVNKRHYRMSSKKGFEGRRSDSLSSHLGPGGRRVNSEKTEAWLHDCDNDNPKIVQRNNYTSKHPHLMRGYGKSLDTEERARCTIMEKEDKLHGEMKRMKGSHDPVRVKRHPTDETTFKVQEMLGVQACKGGCRMPMFGRDADLLIDIVFSFRLPWRGHLVSARMKLQKPVLRQNEELTINGFRCDAPLLRGKKFSSSWQPIAFALDVVKCIRQGPFSNGGPDNVDDILRQRSMPVVLFVKANDIAGLL